MSVYVDKDKNKYGRMLMSHMCADTIDELHEMAERIGVARKWLQNSSRHPHYDICQSKRKLAIEYGAIEVSAREMIKIINKPKAKEVVNV